MFSTDMTNRPDSSLFPRVIGVRNKATYTLETAVGTISSIDSRNFDRAYDLSGRYPSNLQVRPTCLPIELDFH